MYHRLIAFLFPLGLLSAATSPCDLNADGQVNVVDVQRSTNQALGIDTCDGGDLDLNGKCDVVDVQRFINSAMGQECQAAQVTPPPTSGTSLTSTYGAKCDGSTNDRTAIQNAFNNTSSWVNGTLIFPSGKTCLVTSGLNISSKSGWTIEGQGSTIKAANGMCLDGCGPLMKMTNVDQFEINDLTLDGNRANRSPAEKSGGHNFQILAATNGNFKNVTSKNAATDNARIGATVDGNTNTFSKNLTFTDSKFINGYRDNVSVIEGWNIRFLGSCSGGFSGSCTCQFVGANGTNPEAGIDWEPNSASASPAIDNGLVDGCLIANNRGPGHMTTDNGGAQNVTVRNSIIRDNGASSTTIQKDAFVVGGKGILIENNWIGTQAGLRFAVIYVASGKESNTRVTEIRNNLFDGVPPVGAGSGQRRIVHFGNFGDGTAQFKNNTITNSGLSAGGDWCSSGPSGGASTTSGNRLQGVMQSPNPGCP